jgi:hypothetical protein
MADPRDMDEEELMMHLINTGTQVASDDGAKITCKRMQMTGVIT